MIDENIKKLRNDQPEDLVAVNDGIIQYVPGDTENINVDEVVDELGYVEGIRNLLYVHLLSSGQVFAMVLCKMLKSIVTNWGGGGSYLVTFKGFRGLGACPLENF